MAENLLNSLVGALNDLDIASIRFGHSELVARAAEEAGKLFDSASKGSATRDRAYAAALEYLRGGLSDDDDLAYDLLAGLLAEPIKEQENRMILGAGARLDSLLRRYRRDAESGEMWRPTWYGLLSSYFVYMPEGRHSEADRGWYALREFLSSTWPTIAKREGVQPPWVAALRDHQRVLGADSCAQYANKVLANDMSEVETLGQDLGISPSSWFWQQLVVATAARACELDDRAFKAALERIVALLRERPVYKDKALGLLLSRYQKCERREPVPAFKDYVVSKQVWGNPKLKSVGLASAWNRVPDEVWRMALGWVNEANLRLFFELLSARNNAEEGRLAFWSQYIEQITWTKLVFGRDTLNRARSDPQLRALVDQEQGLSARLRSSDDNLDAFLMEVGNHVIVEFSRKPNAAYVYPKGSLPFELGKSSMSGGTDELKSGFHRGDPKIVHVPNWENSAARLLRSMGIHPDVIRHRVSETRGTRGDLGGPRPAGDPSVTNPGGQSGRSATATHFTMQELRAAARAEGATVSDFRIIGGRLWVRLGNVDSTLVHLLRQWGFVYAAKRGEWYLPGK